MHMTIHTRLLPAIAVAAVLVYAGCSRNDTELPGSANTDEKTLPASSFEQDKVRIRVSGSLADSLEAGAGEAFLEALDMIGATDICRTFPMRENSKADTARKACICGMMCILTTGSLFRKPVTISLQ